MQNARDLNRRGRAARPILSTREQRTAHRPAWPRAPAVPCSRLRQQIPAAGAGAAAASKRGRRFRRPSASPSPPPPSPPPPAIQVKDELPETPTGLFGEEPFEAPGPFYGFTEGPLDRCRELKDKLVAVIATVQTQCERLQERKNIPKRRGLQKGKRKCKPKKAKNTPVKTDDSSSDNEVQIVYVAPDETQQCKSPETRRRRSLRLKKNINYREQLFDQERDNVEELSCDECGFSWPGECLVHGPLTPVEDARVPAALAARVGAEKRAQLTVPPQMAVAASAIPHAGHGVWTRVPLPARLRLGPYRGKLMRRPKAPDYSWQLWKGDRAQYVDAGDCQFANWLRYVNCARNEQEQNLGAFQWRGAIYYRTKRIIPAHEELLVWYGEAFAEKLGITPEAFYAPPQRPLPYNNFDCGNCRISFNSPLGLQEHSCIFPDQESTEPLNGLSAPSFRRLRGSNGPNPSREESNLKFVLLLNRTSKNVWKKKLEFEPPRNEDVYQENHYLVAHEQNANSKDITDKTEDLNHCELCKVNFKTSSKLIRHSANVHKVKPYKCTMCNSTFKRFKHLKTHASVHKSEKLYHCYMCAKSYKGKQALRIHWCKKHREVFETFVASNGYQENEPFHNDEASSQNNTRRTSLVVNNEIKPTFNYRCRKSFTCTKCNEKFRIFASLVIHDYTHCPEKLYKCPVCGKKLKCLSSLTYHFKNHRIEKRDVKFHCCNICNEEFESAECLKKHILRHKTAKLHHCQICDATFKTSHGLRWHSYRHTGEQPYECQKCDATFNRPHLLSRHSLEHSNENALICNVCEAQFVSVSGFKKHSVMHHNQTPHRCQVCNVTFTKSLGLKAHLYNTHTNDTPQMCKIANPRLVNKRNVGQQSLTKKTFQCYVCDKTFKRKSFYETHLLIHEDERSYECDICKKTFKLKATYARHVKIHLSKPHQCTECEMRFKTEGLRRKHMRTHTVQKPFSCNVCEKSYCLLKNLNKHKPVHTDRCKINENRFNSMFASNQRRRSHSY